MFRYGSNYAQPSDILVYAGDYSLMNRDPQEKMYFVDRIVVHPMFDVETFDYDFALLHITEELQWSPLVKPICLIPNCMSEIKPRENLTCLVAGWGSDRVSYGMGDERMMTDTLKKQALPVIHRSYCQSALSTRPYLSRFILTAQMTCAGFPKGGVDDCQTDSGAPLVCKTTTDKNYYLHGISSFGFGCGLPANYYRVFARPCSITEWIIASV